MKLPFGLNFQKKEKKDYFLALLLREERISAVIFEELEGKVSVIGEKEEYLHSTIDSTSSEDLLTAIDEAVSVAESSLPNNTETRKTIFGVKENWIENSKIKSEYLAKLKKVSDSIGLSPLGFLIIHEAIIRYMQKEEGAPVSAILVEIDKKTLVVSLVRAGRIIETKTSTINGAIAQSVDKLLQHFTEHEVLPSRVVLFNGGEEERLSQLFISHSWSRQLPFLHVPQVTVLHKGFDAKAVLFGAATQMGFELLPEIRHKKEKLEISHLSKDVDIVKKEETKMINENKSTNEKTLKDISFLYEEDILKEKVLDETSIAITIPKQPHKSYHDESNFININHPDDVLRKKTSPISNILILINSINNKLLAIIPIKNLKNLLMKFSFFPKNKKVIFIPVFISSLFIFLAILYIFELKAIVTISLRAETVEKEENIIFLIEKETDISNNNLGSRLIEISEEASSAIETTGKKEIGEKTKGQLNLYARFDEGKNITAGTIIISSNDLKFTLDKDVSIASVSAADASSVIVKVDITAKNIGKEYNLPSGAKFTIGQISQSIITGKNDEAFSGGSKKEINAVSKLDQDRLLEELPFKSEEKAKVEINKQLKNDEITLPSFTDIKILRTEFSKNIGDEATSLQVNGTINYKTIAYKKSDLLSMAKKVFEKNLKNMTSADDNISLEIKKIKKVDEKQIEIIVLLKNRLIPKIDVSMLQKKISGLSYAQAEKIINEIPQVNDIYIKLQPNIFSTILPHILPKQSKNINFVIESNE